MKRKRCHTTTTTSDTTGSFALRMRAIPAAAVKLLRNARLHGLTLAIAAAVSAGTTSPARAADQERSFEIYGFAMVDAIQDTKRVDPAWMDAFRPSKIATPEGEFGTNGQSSISVKQSRLGVKGLLPTGDTTAPVTFKFEFDFFGVGVDAGQTTIRLRHAYGEWNGLLAGQTNTLFMDGDIFPNVIDYWGPAGMVFFRLPTIRWTPFRTDSSWFSIAIEKPGNDVDPGNIRLIDEYQNATVRGNQTVPDFTAQYRLNGDWGHFQVAGILRKVGYEYQTETDLPYVKGSQTGWGVDVSGAIKLFEKDQILLGVVHGNGIASYMNDGGMDLAPNAAVGPTPPIVPAPLPGLSAEAVPLTGILAYYDHYWGSQWSTSIGYSQTQVTNTNFQEAGTFHKGQYASVNLLWYPAGKVMLGGEVLYGKRTDNFGVTGDDVRFQFSVKYDFGAKL
jgi:DcaP outer membrane protein